jgi:hypothetical protein
LYMQPEIEGIEIWDFPLKLIFAWQREWNGWIGFLVVFLHSWVATRLGLFHGFIMSKASCGWRERVNTRARERRWGRKVFASWFSLSGTKRMNEWIASPSGHVLLITHVGPTCLWVSSLNWPN